jgi:hypothetical protein
MKTCNHELMRNGFGSVNVNTYCTMAQTKTMCNLKDKRNQLKAPKLEELHKRLFDDDIDKPQAHNSCYDVEVCARCYVLNAHVLQNNL